MELDLDFSESVACLRVPWAGLGYILTRREGRKHCIGQQFRKYISISWNLILVKLENCCCKALKSKLVSTDSGAKPSEIYFDTGAWPGLNILTPEVDAATQLLKQQSHLQPETSNHKIYL